MYQVHKKNLNNDNFISIIFKSYNMLDAIDFARQWNETTESIYEGIEVLDQINYYADVFDTDEQHYLDF